MDQPDIKDAANRSGFSKKENSFLLKNIRPLGSQTADVLVRDGIIQQIAVGINDPDKGLATFDGGGAHPPAGICECACPPG